MFVERKLGITKKKDRDVCGLPEMAQCFLCSKPLVMDPWQWRIYEQEQNSLIPFVFLYELSTELRNLPFLFLLISLCRLLDSKH